MSAHTEFELGMRRLGVMLEDGDKGEEGRGGGIALIIRLRGPDVVCFRIVDRGEAAKACREVYRRDPLFLDGASRLSKLRAHVIRRECARLGVDTRASPSATKTATKNVLIARMLDGLRCEGARVENNMSDARNDDATNIIDCGKATTTTVTAGPASSASDDHRDAANGSCIRQHRRQLRARGQR